MKWSFAGVGLIIIGLFGFLIVILFNEITVSNELDYNTLKDATEAAIIESVDVAYYRLTGEIKISQEKFVENFTRRFTETSTFGQGNYEIQYYLFHDTYKFYCYFLLSRNLPMYNLFLIHKFSLYL